MKGKKILLGVTGGIAAYKACSLVNYFIKEGADVKVIMTTSAKEFVTPLTFQALTNHAVYINMFQTINHEEVEHISLAKWADICVVAPTSANTVSKVAVGIADNLLTTVIMALPRKTKVIFAPAMNTEMWNNDIVQRNIETLKKQDNKYVFIEPEKGVLACKEEGIGKIADINKILKVVIENVK